MTVCKCRQFEALTTMAEIRDKELLPSYRWVQRWIQVYTLTWWFPYIQTNLIEPIIKRQMLIHISNMDKWEEDKNQSFFHTHNCQYVGAKQKSYKELISTELDDPFWRINGRRNIRAIV